MVSYEEWLRMPEVKDQNEEVLNREIVSCQHPM